MDNTNETKKKRREHAKQKRNKKRQTLGEINNVHKEKRKADTNI